MRILIFICGEGLGHTSRCTALGRELLAAGHEVHFGAYGYSKKFVERKGYKTHELPPEIKLVGASGGLDLKKSVLETLKGGNAAGLLKVLKLLKETDPEIVVSDSYFTGVLASKIRKLPVYFIVNQSNMEVFFKNGGIAFQGLGSLIKLVYRDVFRRVDRVIVPDYPLPFTLCKLNLDFESQISKEVFFSGPLVLKKYDEVTPLHLKNPHVLSLIGGFGYRKPIFDKILEVANLDRSINYTLLSGPNLDPSVFSSLPANVTLKPFIEDQFPYLKASELVIAPGGHSTIMEALSFGIPVLSFPDMKHFEQESNAKGLEVGGFGKSLSYEASSAQILSSIKELLEDKKIRENVKRMKNLSEELNAPVAIRQLLEPKQKAYSREAKRTGAKGPGFHE